MKARSLLMTLMAALPISAGAGSLTISGISSGGFMASQMATIYSDQYAGVATVAGGVFYCAQDGFQQALKEYGPTSYLNYGVDSGNILKNFGIVRFDERKDKETPPAQPVTPLPSNPVYQPVGVCMGHPEGAHSPETLKDSIARPMDLGFLKNFEEQKLIAPTSFISKQRVFIYQGKGDQVVRSAMAEKIKEFYTRMGVAPSALKTVLASGNHNFPTLRKDGIDCNEARFPYIANCGRDLAGEILEHVLGRKLVRNKFNILHLRRIEQKGAPSSLAKSGYIYATPYCLNNPSSCDLHVALHGCQMNDDFDGNFQKLYQTKVQLTHILGVPNYELAERHPQMGGLSFARRSGYAEYAEDVTNHLMILFPQTQITSDNYPSNPNGCWDWFGWTGSDYATNKGKETAWLNSYVQQIRKNPKSFFMTKVTE